MHGRIATERDTMVARDDRAQPPTVIRDASGGEADDAP